MKRFSFLLAFLVVAGCGCPCDAQTEEVRRAPRVDELKWFDSNGGPTLDVLYFNDTLIGQWNHETRKFRPFINGRLGPECEPPIAPRGAPASLIAKGENFGVDFSKINGPSYSISGVPATREEVFEAMDNDIPDDGKKARVTVMGGEKYREPIMRALRDWIDKSKLEGGVLLWSGAADDLILKRRGFVCPCEVTVFVQDPKGKELAKLKNPSPDDAVRTVEEVLRRDMPTLFPGPPILPRPASGWPLSNMETLAAAALALLAVYVIKK